MYRNLYLYLYVHASPAHMRAWTQCTAHLAPAPDAPNSATGCELCSLLCFQTQEKTNDHVGTQSTASIFGSSSSSLAL